MSRGEAALGRAVGRYPGLLRALTKAKLLILDDRGPDRLTAVRRCDLMAIVEHRYHNRAVLITRQLPVDPWHEIIGEPAFADAMLDRIVHNAHRIERDGPSMRKTMAAEDDPLTIDQTEGK